jgi:hypothetical protein
VVVTDDEAADAYTLPGVPCRIVITAGMLRALSQPERQVLLAHERAHASGLHYLFTTAARLAARAIAHAALAATVAPPRRPAPAAAVLGAVSIPARTHRAGPVPRRVAALLSPPPQPQLLLVFAAVLLVAVSGLSALEAARDLHALLVSARAAATS